MSDERFGRYQWNADNNQKHLEKHGISFQSAAIALEHGRPVDVPAKVSGRDEQLAYLNGETMKVVTARDGECTRIITAHKKEENDTRLDRMYDAKAAEQGVAKNTAFNKEFEQWRESDDVQRQRAKEPVDALKNKQEAERNTLKNSTDVSPEKFAQLQAEQTEQHKQQAEQDRQPRLERDSKERQQIAQEQGQKVELIDGRNQEGDRSPPSNEAKPQQAEKQQARYNPKARRETAREQAREEARNQTQSNEDEKDRGR